MQIQLNGETTALPEATTVAALLEQLGLAGKRVAVECNNLIVPRSAHTTTTLHDGDTVEIVHAIGGG
jgi:sulfur carrier protein